jgi:hypothetical protein
VTLNETLGNESDAVDKIMLTHRGLERKRQKPNQEMNKSYSGELRHLYSSSGVYAHDAVSSQLYVYRVGRPTLLYNPETFEVISTQWNIGVVPQTLLKEFNFVSYGLLYIKLKLILSLFFKVAYITKNFSINMHI